MEEQTFWYLENIDLTSLLCPIKLGSDKIMSAHQSKTYAKGDFVYIPKEEAQQIYFIREGKIKIYTMNAEGKEVTIALLAKGEVFGELALAGSKERHDFAVALEDTEVCIVGVHELQGLMREHTALSLFFWKTFGKRQLVMEQRLTSLVFRDSRSRIIEFLLQLVEEKGTRVGYEWLVRNFITHQEIANLTATSRQTVTTTLNDLRSRNLLTFNRSRLLVRDLLALKNEMRN